MRGSFREASQRLQFRNESEDRAYAFYTQLNIKRSDLRSVTIAQ